MPLSAPAEREEIHHRSIDCRSFRRTDGLWDIEAHMTDTKTYTFSNAHRGDIVPGEALHDMWLRVTIDDGFVVHKVEAQTDAGPFAICPAITPRFAALEGVTIGRGWNRRVRELLGGTQGCTHLVDLLRPIATVAFQTLWALRKSKPVAATDKPRRRPGYINQCHALDSTGEVVRESFPDWYDGAA